MLRGRVKRRLSLLTLAVLGLLAAPGLRQHATGQQSAIQAVSEETYYKVLDLVFPRDILQDHKLRFVFVLRYEPTFHAESQFIIAERWGKTEVVEYKSLDGSIEMKLNEIVHRTGKENAEQMAKQIRVQKRYIELPRAEIVLLHEQFFESLRLSENNLPGVVPERVIITQDGTGYRLWYSGIVDIQSDFLGSGIRSPTRPDESPLQEWMKNVYRKIAAASEASRR